MLENGKTDVSCGVRSNVWCVYLNSLVFYVYVSSKFVKVYRIHIWFIFLLGQGFVMDKGRNRGKKCIYFSVFFFLPILRDYFFFINHWRILRECYEMCVCMYIFCLIQINFDV